MLGCVFVRLVVCRFDLFVYCDLGFSCVLAVVAAAAAAATVAAATTTTATAAAATAAAAVATATAVCFVPRLCARDTRQINQSAHIHFYVRKSSGCLKIDSNQELQANALWFKG